MYINRKGIVDNHGLKATVKEFFFDVESMLLIMAKDCQRIMHDFGEDVFRIYESILDIRWDVFMYKMHSTGLLSDEVKVSRPRAAMYSLLSIVLLKR